MRLLSAGRVGKRPKPWGSGWVCVWLDRVCWTTRPVAQKGLGFRGAFRRSKSFGYVMNHSIILEGLEWYAIRIDWPLIRDQ